MDNVVDSIPQSTVFHSFSKEDNFSPIGFKSKDVENCGKLVIMRKIRALPTYDVWENM